MWCSGHTEESLFSLRGLLKWVKEVTNVIDISCNLDLRSHVIAKHSKGSDENASRWQNNSLCQTSMSLSYTVYVKFQREKHRLVKHFAFLKIVCYQYLNCVLRVTYCFFTGYWYAHNQLYWCNKLVISCNLIGQLCRTVR